MHLPINVFPQSVGWWDYPGELDIFENWLSNSLPMSHKFVSKISKWLLKLCVVSSRISLLGVHVSKFSVEFLGSGYDLDV